MNGLGGLQFKTTGLVLDVANQKGGSEPSTSILRDFSSHGNDGTMTNITWTQTAEDMWCMVFADDDCFVSLPASFHRLLNGAIGITAWCWFKLDSFPADGTQDIIFATNTSDTPSGGLNMSIVNSGTTIKMRIGGRSQAADGFQQMVSTANFGDTSSYHFFAGIWDFTNSEITMVLDGVVQGPTGVTWGSSIHVTTATTTIPTIGGLVFMPSTVQFNGNLASFGIVTFALSTTQLASIKLRTKHPFGV